MTTKNYKKYKITLKYYYSFKKIYSFLGIIL